ncbi:hypothetical protein [Streptomyces sp. NPDC094049]|uniref:hypothetical protein n=1 Tax=Streptomyces sp. NPDC094049 TaxID=3154987 RepID=UPI00331BC0AE
MASAPLRPRSARPLTAVAALVAAATAPLALAAPAPAAPAPAARAAPLALHGGPAALRGRPAAPVPTPPALRGGPAVPAPDPPTPVCGTPSGSAFPLGARIRGGPADYPAGAAFQEWWLDLTNTTTAPCSGIHPVLVLADRDRVLRPGQIRFEFYDEGAARWRPVAFEATDEAENVGVFTGFGGFAVPAGGTLTVPVRLAFRAGTAPEEVVVSAAVVQRRGADGDWVGESGDYRLTIGPGGPDGAAEPDAPTAPDAPATPPADASTDAPVDPSVGTPAPGDGPAPPPAPDTSGGPRPPASTPRPPAATAVPERAEPEPSGIPTRPELAQTGRESEETARRAAPYAGLLVLLGAALVLAGRRVRHPRVTPRTPSRSSPSATIPR